MELRGWNRGVFGVELRGFWCRTEGYGTEEHPLKSVSKLILCEFSLNVYNLGVSRFVRSIAI